MTSSWSSTWANFMRQQQEEGEDARQQQEEAMKEAQEIWTPEQIQQLQEVMARMGMDAQQASMNLRRMASTAKRVRTTLQETWICAGGHEEIWTVEALANQISEPRCGTCGGSLMAMKGEVVRRPEVEPGHPETLERFLDTDVAKELAGEEL